MTIFRPRNTLDIKPKKPCNPFAHLDNHKGDPFFTPEHKEALLKGESKGKTKSGHKLGR